MRALTQRNLQIPHNNKVYGIPRSPVTRSAKISVTKEIPQEKPEKKKKIEHRSKHPQQETPKKTKRRYFKVLDDWQIMLTIKKYSKSSIRKISQRLSAKLKRSVRSVRSRIRNYLTKLDKFDLKKIKFAALVYF